MSLVGDDGKKSQQIYFLFIAVYYSNRQMCDVHILHRVQLIYLDFSSIGRQTSLDTSV